MRWPLFLIFILLAGCQTQTYEVGVIAPLTGPVAICGKEMTAGLNLAEKVLGDEMFEYTIQDSEFNPMKAVTIFNKYVQQDNLKVIFGPCSSSSTLAVAPLAEQNKILLLTPTSFAEDITQAGDYIFRLASTPGDEVPYMSKFLFEDVQAKKIAIIYHNNDAGVSYTQAMIESAEKNNVEVAFSEGVDPPVNDFRTLLLKSKDVDFLFIMLPAIQASNLVKQHEELGLENQLASSSLIETLEYKRANKDVNREVYFVSAIDSNNLKLEEYKQNLYDLYPDEIPSRDQIQTYVGAVILSHALKECAPVPDCLKQELYDLKDFETPMGTIYIDENGDAKYPNFYIKKFLNGKIEMVK